MSGFDTAAALKASGLAAIGFLAVLAIGVAIGLAIDEYGFAGLGIIALTTVILAPIGAVIGAYIGLRRFGDPGRSRAGWGIMAVIATTALAAILVVEAPFQIMVAIVGLTLILIVRSGFRASSETTAITSDAPAV